MMADRYRYEIVGLPNPKEVSAKARAMVSEIALGLQPPPDANISATLAASSVQWSLFAVFAINGLTRSEAEAACALAVNSLAAAGVFNDQRPEGQA
jgi:hypothetical protein